MMGSLSPYPVRQMSTWIFLPRGGLIIHLKILLIIQVTQVTDISIVSRNRNLGWIICDY